jgi:hypothetical protein
MYGVSSIQYSVYTPHVQSLQYSVYTPHVQSLQYCQYSVYTPHIELLPLEHTMHYDTLTLSFLASAS